MSAPPVDRDLSKIAPAFRGAVISALEACVRDGIDAMVYEAMRTDTQQRAYFNAGTSNAQTVAHSWHGYGLAVDVISRGRGWAVWPERENGVLVRGDPTWYPRVIDIFKRYGCDWGGDWPHYYDAPHFQWGKCKPSPSDEARALMASGGMPAVWAAVGAS